MSCKSIFRVYDDDAQSEAEASWQDVDLSGQLDDQASREDADDSTGCPAEISDLCFHHARLLRSSEHGELWFGIVGTCAYLNGIRADLSWSRSVAAPGAVDQSWKSYCKNQAPHSFSYLVATIQGLAFAFEASFWTYVPLWQNKTLGPGPQELLLLGALYPPALVDSNEWWRIASCHWVHSGVFHFIPCMILLLNVSPVVERGHGWFKTSLCYALTSIGGSVIGCLFNNKALSANASVGIFGLLGMSLADASLNVRVIYSVWSRDPPGYERNPVRVVVGLALLFWCYFGFTKTRFIDGFSHGGAFWLGLCFGIAITKPIDTGSQLVKRGSTRHQHFMMMIVKLLAGVAAFASVCTALYLFLNKK